MTEQEAKEFIESIAADKRRQDSADLRNALRLLAEELNSKDSHFILELIQNAEDNSYSVSHPELHIAIVDGNPCGVPGVQATLIAHNNEQGFLPENVRSLASVGQSTKKKEGATGYIGEKGIGFKSVFRVTDEPHIFSGPFRFKFKKPTPDEPTGYILPYWIPTVPDGLKPEFTSIFLPLLPGKAEGIAAQLGLVAPETLLFLKRIRTLRLGPDRQISTDGALPRIRLTGPGGTSDYFVHSVAQQVPESARDERRTGVTTREISIAFPIDRAPQTASTVFAFLPTEIRSGLPFLINADFVVSSNREGILEDRPWNRWMRDQVGVGFANAFLALLEVTDLRDSAWRHLPDFDKPEQRHPFLEPCVAIALRHLADSRCIPTDQGILAKPNTVHLLSASMRELLANSPDREIGAHLVHPAWSRAPRPILRRLGVTDLAFTRLLEVLNDPVWLAQQDVAWWINLLSCCKEDNQTKESLGQFPILRCQDGRCRSAQDTVYVGQPGIAALVEIRPEWPPAFIADPDLLAAIRSKPDLATWFNRTFALPVFSISQYIDHSLIPWIREQINDGRLQLAVRATLFIAHQCSMDRALCRNITTAVPWSSYGPSALGAGLPQTVTPEGFEHGLPWYRVLQSSTDRAHLEILHQAYRTYATEPERALLWQLMQMEGITDCPKPSSNFELGYRSPQWLSQLASGSQVQEMSASFAALEEWLSRLHETDPDVFAITPWATSSELLNSLQSRPWLPSTSSRSAPRRTFFDVQEIRDFLGDEVPYSRSRLPEVLLAKLGVQRSLPSGTLMQILRDFRNSPNPPQRLILSIYKRLNSQTFESQRFHEEPLIWLASPSPKWLTAAEVTWKDYGTEMDGLTWSVERTYGDHELHGFFVKTIGVTEMPSSRQLLTIWANLSQEVTKSRSETQKRIGFLLGDLTDLDFLGEPWWPERQSSLRIWTESGAFEDPSEVYVPDSGHAEELFGDIAPIAWIPKGGSKGIRRLLQQIGCESLAQSLRSRLHRRPEVINRQDQPDFLTAATKELILLATQDNSAGKRDAPLLKALLQTRECLHADLLIRYELQGSPWWKDAHSAAHWDAEAALLLVDPKADPEEQRTDAAKSIARALYPGDPGQHERIFTLLSKTAKHAAKIAKDQKWVGSPEHFALLAELGMESFLEAAPIDEAGSTTVPKPQRHTFPDAAPKSEGPSERSDAPNSQDGGNAPEGVKPGSSSRGSEEPPSSHSRSSEGSGSGSSGQAKEAGEPSSGHSPPANQEADAEHQEESEPPRKVKYPHDQRALMVEEAPEAPNTESAHRPQQQGGNQATPDGTNGRRRQRANPDRNRNIEKAAMEHVRKTLVDQYPGCEVFDVSHKREYGHDFLMKWRGSGLRIEVKGHSGDESTVVLTPTELTEARKRTSTYRWELWNVTNLTSRKPVMITRYSAVPDGAIIRETGVRVDLSRCVQARGRIGPN